LKKSPLSFDWDAWEGCPPGRQIKEGGIFGEVELKLGLENGWEMQESCSVRRGHTDLRWA
jgi:hypothetical protein